MLPAIDVTGMFKFVIISSIISSLIYGGYYIMNLQSAFQIEKQNRINLEQSVKEQNNVIFKLQNNYNLILKINNDLRQERINLDDKLNKIEIKFNESKNGEKRDFSKLVYKKPKWLESLINKGTEKEFRCLEIISGSKQTKGEINEKFIDTCK